MTKAKELVSGVILVLIAASFVSVYMLRQRGITMSRPAFIYEEIVVSNTAAKILPANKTQAVPAPVNPATSALPIVPPKILSSFTPEYPATALAKGIEGIAVVSAKIGLDGNVNNAEAKVSSGAAQLDEAAAKAVSQWKFSPASQGGAAIASVFEVPVRFSIK